MDVLIADVIGEVALVLILARLFGAAARHCGQPSVVGQLVGGILLGPSLLGRIPGHLSSHLFPRTALPSLTVLSQVAIVIFMFVVGYELDWRSLHGRRQAGLLVAAGALLVPLALGSGSVLIFRSDFANLGEVHISHSSVLFMGVAMSVTALPVLAAIIRERGIAGSTAGVTATAAAGMMDVTAWLVLAAALVGTTDKQGRPWPMTLLLIGGFAVIMLVAVRPVLRWWIRRPRSVLTSQLPLALALALGSAWVTASLGLHPVFGGFLAGLIMPTAEGTPDAEILRPMEEIGGMFLPLFFVVTGLSVNVGALDRTAFMLLALLCVVAAAGKLFPAYAASRVSGLDHADAATVAVLVNTRGLTELIVLNVGLSAGLIDQRIFSVLVLMALATTIATAPLLRLIGTPTSASAPSVASEGPSRDTAIREH